MLPVAPFWFEAPTARRGGAQRRLQQVRAAHPGGAEGAFVSVRSAGAFRCILYSLEAPKALPCLLWQPPQGGLAVGKPPSCSSLARRPGAGAAKPDACEAAAAGAWRKGCICSAAEATATTANSVRNAGGAAIDVAARAAARASNRVLSKGRAAHAAAQRAATAAARSACSAGAASVSPRCGTQLKAALLLVETASETVRSL